MIIMMIIIMKLTFINYTIISALNLESQMFLLGKLYLQSGDNVLKMILSGIKFKLLMKIENLMRKEYVLSMKRFRTIGW